MDEDVRHVTLDRAGHFVWGENIKGFGRPIRVEDVQAVVLAPAVTDLVRGQTHPTRRIGSEDHSWIVSARTLEQIAVFEDLVGPGETARCCDVTLLLHGGNRVGPGWIVYSRDERWILPVFEYLHTILVFVETGRSLLHLYTTLRSLVFLDFFLANIFKMEYCVSRESLHPFHRLVLKKMFTMISTFSYAGHVTLSKVAPHL